MSKSPFLSTLLRHWQMSLLLAILLAFSSAGASFESFYANAAALNATETRVPSSVSRPIGVVVVLRTTPVSVVYAQSQRNGVAAAAISASTQMQLATIEAEQQSVLAQLAPLQTTVIYRTQRAFNGIALHIAPEKLPQLAQMAEVQAIYPLLPKVPMQEQSLPVIGAPTLWQGMGESKLTGQGMRVAVIDTGIDYIHSDLGGPGNVNLYAQNDLTTKEDGMPFPNAKVVGGYDFSGDSYDADPESVSYQPNPQPDSDPMDCYGHGTHVAGTVAGSGVRNDGSAYTGPYDAALSLDSLRIAPGVAPQAQLYALKIFGCSGSSELADLAIEWAMDPNGDGDLSDHVDVINMSLGSSYGAQADVSTIASNNAVAAGVIVVASAGNSGDIYYITGSPAVADGAISVAASSYDTVNQVDLLASFSSRGPRRGDSALKPDIAAPGVNIDSAAAGSGSFGRLSSGTSMSAPHIAGAMALLRQLHPEWTVEELKALVMNSAQPFVHLGASLLSDTYPATRVGAGRVDLPTAAESNVIAFDDDAPDRVSLSFGELTVAERSSFTRTLAVVNKGTTPFTSTLAYSSRLAVPGVAVKLPQTTLVLPINTVVHVPIVLVVDPAALQRTYDNTLQDIGTRYWQSEVIGNLELQPASAEPTIHVPLYAIARPASTLQVVQDHFVFTDTVSPAATLTFTGSSLSSTDPMSGYNSLVSLSELQWSSPQERPVAPIDPRLVVGPYDNGDIQYLGIYNDLQQTGSISNSTLYFGVTTYGEWSTPNEVELSIYLDINQDGNADYRLYNTNRFSMIDKHLNSDRFIAALENLQTQAKTNVAALNGLAADQGDAALFNNNVLVIPLPVSQIGLAADRPAFTYWIESKVAELGGVVDRSPVLHYDLRQQMIDVVGADNLIGQAVTGGDQTQLRFEPLRGSGEETILLFFHHNQAGKRVQLVTMQGTVLRYYFPTIVK